MIKKYNNISFAWGIPGIAIQIASNFIENETTSILVGLIGTALLIVGFAYYAKGLGRTPAWGLLGLLSIVGLIILLFLPDLKKDASPDSQM